MEIIMDLQVADLNLQNMQIIIIVGKKINFTNIPTPKSVMRGI
jgi:hypothetical protein